MSCLRRSSAWLSRSSGLWLRLFGCSRGSVLSRVQASNPDCKEALWRTQQASRMDELLSGEYCKQERRGSGYSLNQFTANILSYAKTNSLLAILCQKHCCISLTNKVKVPFSVMTVACLTLVLMVHHQYHSNTMNSADCQMLSADITYLPIYQYWLL